MKLYATLSNNKKLATLGGDTSICAQFHYSNEIAGEMTIYTIHPGHSTAPIGYRIVWRDDKTPTEGLIIKEVNR